MVTYRKPHGSDTWHYCRNCPEDPKSGYQISYSKPTTGELCDEYRGIKSAGHCRP